MLPRDEDGTEGRGAPAAEPAVDGAASSLRAEPPAVAATALHTAAHEAATSPTNDLQQPTEAQIKVGNYKKGHVKLNGFDISIENPAGTSRRPEWPPLANHYGYFKGTVGKDKDHVDVFLTDRAEDASLPVFVVDQIDPKTGKFDEHKVVLGAADEPEARKTYLQNYSKGWTGLGAITQMSQDEFKTWVKDPVKTKQPAAKASPVAVAEEVPAMPAPQTENDRVRAAMRDAEIRRATNAIGHIGNPKQDGAAFKTVKAANALLNSLPNKADYGVYGVGEGYVLRPVSQDTGVGALDARWVDQAAHKTRMAANAAEHESRNKAADANAEKRARIDADFASNRAAIAEHGFKKGDEVQFDTNGRTFSGTILSLGDKEQGTVAVGVPGTRGVADYHVGARFLRRATADDSTEKPTAGDKGSAEQATDQPTTATHADPGEPAEAATADVIAEAAAKADRAPTVSMAQARKDLLVQIDAAIKVAPAEGPLGSADNPHTTGPKTVRGTRVWDVGIDRTLENGLKTPTLEIQESASRLEYRIVHRGAKLDTAHSLLAARLTAGRLLLGAEWHPGGAAGSWTFKEPADSVAMVTLDVKGDGTFKVRNTKERLQAFRAQVEREFKLPSQHPAPGKPSMRASEAERAKIMAEAETVDDTAPATPGPEAADERNTFTVQRASDGGGMEDVTFTRGEKIKVFTAAGKAMTRGTISGISQAKREFRVEGSSLWLPFSYAYKADYDEKATPRKDLQGKIDRLRERLAQDQTADAEKMARDIRTKAVSVELGREFADQLKALDAAVTAALARRDAQLEAARVESARREAEMRTSRPSAAKVEPVRMTMAEWKATHKDHKAIIDGQRTVMRPGGMVPVEIIKEEAPATVPTERQALGLPRVMRKTDAVKFLRKQAGVTEAVAEAAFESLDRKGLKEGTRLGDDVLAKAKSLQTAEPTTEESSSVAPTSAGTLEGQLDLLKRVADGTASLDEYRAGFEALRANKAQILADLGKLTIDKLLPLNGMNARRSDGKERLVRGAYNDLVTDYNLSGSFTWSMGQKIDDVMAAKVADATEQTLREYADKVAASRAERKARVEAAEAGMQDPKTIEDFTRVARSLGGEAKLTPEQRETFDRLRAEARREQREAEARRNAEIRRVDTGTTGMTLIETKHTQKGHDLFVVRMDERVERDVYDRLNTAAKRLGGYYSSFKGNGAVPGFQFTTREAAEKFMAVREGNVDTSEQQEARAAAKAEDRAESLAEKAEKLRAKATESLNRERKDNTERRASMAASAEESARREIAQAETMAKIAEAIEAGTAGLLEFVRHRTQVELLGTLLQNAHDAHMREQGVNWEKAKEEPITKAALVNTTLPTYHLSRGDAVKIARRLVATRGGKQLGTDLAKQVDYGDEYGEAVKANPYKFTVGKRRADSGEQSLAFFAKKSEAEAALRRSPNPGQFMVVKLPNMKAKEQQWAVALAPDLAIERKLWAPDYDKKVHIPPSIAEKIMAVLGETGNKYGEVVPYWWSLNRERRSQLAKLGIETNYELREALRQYLDLRQAPADEDKVRKLERALAGKKEVGVDFFPTPPAVVQRLVEQADIGNGMRVLEPSAGKGDIAEALRDAADDVQVDTVEMSGTLREILEAKGFDAIGHDFLTAPLEPVYDRIVMNPPFLNDNGAAHVRHAYNLLKPGGRLVAVMGNGMRGKAEFEKWLESVGGLAEPLPEGSFKSSFRPTGVATQVVVIDKARDSTLASTEELDFDSLPLELQQSFLRQSEQVAEDAAERELAAQMSRDDGEADADRYGLRKTVERVLGPAGLRVQYLRGYEGLPEGVGEGAATRFEGRDLKTAALYDPTSQTVYLFTHVVKDPNRAAWHAAHEIAGHDGLRKLLGNKLDASLRLAGENDTVSKLADAIAKDRGLKPSERLLAIEEALSELAAAVRTGNFDHIQERYGVAVPQGIRAKVEAVIREFLRRLKNLLANHLGAKFSDADVREMLEAAWKAAQGEGETAGEAQASASNEAPFYSALHRAVIAGKGAPKKADAAAWKGWLDGAQRRGEFRQGERDWLGVDAWLDGRSVTTREELADFIRANAVQVQDVVLGDPTADTRNARQRDIIARLEGEFGITAMEGDSPGTTDWIGFTVEGGPDPTAPVTDWPPEAAALRDEWEGMLREEQQRGGPAKFASYQLPGGANYRELLLTLPSDTPDRDSSPEYYNATTNDFRSSHFEQPNILAHVRFNKRTDADGKRVLFLEEIQSDWHQAGRKKGYIGDEVNALNAAKQEYETLTQRMVAVGLGRLTPNERARIEELRPIIRGQGRPVEGVPNAPFKGTDEWAMLAFKRMVRWAAEHGFDRIAWTTGEQQAERYDLSKRVAEVRITRIGKDEFDVVAPTREGGRGISQTGLTASALADTVGKDLADKAASLDEGVSHTYRGVDLKVGGEGMRAFYDKILPAAVNKWAKRFGGKVVVSSIDRPVPKQGRPFITNGEMESGDFDIEKQPIHALDLTDAMREAALAGQPLFSADRALASTEPGTFSVRTPTNPPAADLKIPGEVKLSRSAFASVKEMLTALGKGKLTDLRPLMLASIPLNHLVDFAKKGMHAVEHYVDLQYKMQAFRNTLYREYDAIAQDWLAYGTKGAGLGGLLGRRINAQGQELADLMHDSTIASVDPSLDESEYADDAEKASIYRALRARYEALPEQGQKLYRDVRDAYSRQLSLLERTLEQNVQRAMEINLARADRKLARDLQEIEEADIPEAEKDQRRAIAHAAADKMRRNANQSVQAKIIGLRQRFEAQRVEAPYFPLKRYGKYWATVLDGGKMVGFAKFETAAEQAAFAEQMRTQGLDTRLKYEDSNASIKEMIDPKFVAEIESLIADLTPEDATPEQTRQLESLQDDIWQAYLERLPDMSLRKSFIHRKKVQGYHPDALRAFSSSMFHSSYQLARLKYGMEMGEALDLAEEQANRNAPVEGNQLVAELRKRHDFILNPKGGVAAQVATTAAFVYHLGANPAHLFLNATQTVMLGVPVLGSRYGFGRTVGALQRAMTDFAKGRGHIEKARLSDDERVAMQAFMDAGLIDKTQAHDLAGVGETGVEYSAVRQKVMNKLGWFFHQSERFNREVTVLAAYRLARQGGDSHAQAINRAMRDTYTIHFDYSASARPRWMQNDTAKMLLVFRNYNVNVLYRLFRDIHQSLRGESPQARREARKQLGAMMGMYGLFAGTMGVPFYGLAMALAGLFEDDDDPFTAEQQFVQGTVELLGPDIARVLLRGVPGAVFNVDLSERIGMPNLWFRSPDRELEGRDAYYFWMEQLLGAAPAVAKNVFDGLQLVNEGKIERGVEKMLPSALRSPVRAARFATEGATTLEGQPIAPISAGGVIAQALGYTPLELTEQYDRNSTLKGADSRLERRRSRLLDRYFLAAQAGDASDLQAAGTEIAAFNTANPAYAITRKTLNRSEKLRERNRLMNQNGIVLTRRMRALQEELDGAGD